MAKDPIPRRISGRAVVAMVQTAQSRIADHGTGGRRTVHVRFCERLGVRLPGPTLLIVWNQRSLRRTLLRYFAYYQRSRTHLALAKDAPEPRAVEPPQQGRVVAIPQVGGLHHRYQRRAA